MIRINMLPHEKALQVQPRSPGKYYSLAVVSVAAVLALGWYMKYMTKTPEPEEAKSFEVAQAPASPKQTKRGGVLAFPDGHESEAVPAGRNILHESRPASPESQTVDKAALEAADVKDKVMAQTQASIVEDRAPKTVQEVDMKASDLKSALMSVEAWRLAWSERDVDSYFAAYGDNFVPSGRFDLIEEWKRYKRRVILSKVFIHVSLGDIKADLLESGRHVAVRFLQQFSSDSFSSENEKELVLEKGDNGWKIVREISK